MSSWNIKYSTPEEFTYHSSDKKRSISYGSDVSALPYDSILLGDGSSCAANLSTSKKSDFCVKEKVWKSRLVGSVDPGTS